VIRDLLYPEDARKVIDGLVSGLECDAALAVLGNHCPNAPLPSQGPDFSTPIRFGGIEADSAVRREAPALLPRFSLISMVSRFERHAQLLLLQRRVLEELRNTGKKMTSVRFWAILKQVHSEARKGLVKVCSELLVEHPSTELVARMEWLTSVYRVRNCLAHRMGVVQMEDVKRPGTSIEDVQESDRLRAKWMRVKPSIAGKEVTLPHTPQEAVQLNVGVEEYQREWSIGDQIDISASDCQAIAMSFALLGRELLHEFEGEMNPLLGLK
jgi:hypothetical protein